MKKFINLHNNTEYSFLDSLIKINDLVLETKKNGLDTAVLTDHNNLFGLGIFLKKCDEENIKPIIGIDLDVQDYRFIVLAKNYQGFIKINNLSLKALSNIFINFDELNDENLFVIDHPVYGLYAKTNKMHKLDFKNYFVNDEDVSISNAILVKENKVIWRDQYETLKVIQKISNLQESKEPLFNFEDNPTNNQIIIERIDNIIEQCNVVFPKPTLDLPNFDNLSNEDAKFRLKSMLNEGLKNKKNNLIRFSSQAVLQRINYEYETICNLNFQQYFLIIADLIKWAKSQNIAIGPGRGSAAGSLISYLLDITEINPLEHDLLFERFLNPERVSWPDIDIDIQDNRRSELIDYLFTKYGKDKVCLISTFQTIGAKMAIRDVGRILNIDLPIVDRISKSLKVGETLASAYKDNPIFKSLIKDYPDLLTYSLEIEGQPRQQGTHAAGIVLSSKKIVDIVPTCPTNDGLYFQTQLPMNYLENFGLLKIDLLGLKTLTEIKDMEKYLKPNQFFENIVKKDFLELNDPTTFAMLNLGYTEGLFQLESYGMRKTIKQVHLDSFNDLYAIISLFRPGPLEYISEYSNNKKNPKNIKKIHPLYDDIVKSTYGIIVYQEQIMQIAQKVASMSFGQADLLRRAISKKDEIKMKAYRSIFYEGAIKNKIPSSLINEIYDNIEKFADYGFNKSHAVAYSFLTMKMAYYKARYPLYFYASLISNASGNQEKINKYANEIKNLNCKVKSPDIQFSSKEAVIVDNSIYLPFEMIKGLGMETVEKITKLQKTIPSWNNLMVLFLRLKDIGLKDNNINLLIQSNAFRRYGNMETVENTFNLISESFKAIMDIQDPEDKENEIKRFEYADFLQYKKPQNITYEASKEQQYLGSIYNAFLTVPYEKEEFKLIDLFHYKEGKFVVEIVEYKKLPNRDLYIIKYRDSSYIGTSFLTTSETKKYLPLKVGNLVKLNLYCVNDTFRIKDIEGVINA